MMSFDPGSIRFEQLFKMCNKLPLATPAIVFHRKREIRNSVDGSMAGEEEGKRQHRMSKNSAHGSRHFGADGYYNPRVPRCRLPAAARRGAPPETYRTWRRRA